MLRELEIRDMIVIDRLTIEFQSGLNVLTGETGAGKSILLDCLGFVLGWRTRANLVRGGADKGEVTAVFDLPDGHPALHILKDGGYGGEGELIIRRVSTPEGRKTAWVNDRRATGEILRRLSETLVELHGQHDDRGLLNTKGHRDLLDEFGRLGEQRAACRKAWVELSESEAALSEHAAQIEALRAEEEFLRHAVDELTDLDPQPGEEAELDGRRRLMKAGARIGEDVAKAAQALSSDGAEGNVSDAIRWLEGTSGDIGDRLDPALAALARAMNELGDASVEVEKIIEDLHVDPRTLETLEDRLFAIRGLARKHACAAEDLPRLNEEFSARLDALDSSGAMGAALSDAAEKAQAAYASVAEKLSAQRQKSAKKLDASVMKELAPLKMDRAVFETSVQDADPSAEGVDRVEFTVATNPGTPQGPLAKIASGGELSRFLLALKVSLSGEVGGATAIFDEIDRGVGGATADAVGKRLAQLAQGGQVLVVTHSPQVAALGQHHWQVSKEIVSGQTFSRVSMLRDDERIDEIARMLAGDKITDAARAAARELLSA